MVDMLQILTLGFNSLKSIYLPAFGMNLFVFFGGCITIWLFTSLFLTKFLGVEVDNPYDKG